MLLAMNSQVEKLVGGRKDKKTLIHAVEWQRFLPELVRVEPKGLRSAADSGRSDEIQMKVKGDGAVGEKRAGREDRTEPSLLECLLDKVEVRSLNEEIDITERTHSELTTVHRANEGTAFEHDDLNTMLFEYGAERRKLGNESTVTGKNVA